MVARVSADVTFPLRHRVLGRHARPEELARPDDDAPDSGHFVAYDAQGEVVATGTVRRHATPSPLEAEHGWQVRGMAVADDRRGVGLGTSVLSALVGHVAACGGGLMWCHVRTRAVSLYERMGFVCYGQLVEDEVAGPQVLMARPVEASEVEVPQVSSRHQRAGVTTGLPTLLADALRAANAVVAAVPRAGWALPTPCSSWCTRDVLNHVIATTTKFSMFACGRVDSPLTPVGDLLGADPLAAFERCRASSAEAWANADLQRRCHLPFGSYPAAEAAAINAFDVLVHTWDLAQAVALPYKPDPRLTELAYMVAVRLVTPEAVAAGHYARLAETPPSSGTPTWRDVLVLTGREAAA